MHPLECDNVSWCLTTCLDFFSSDACLGFYRGRVLVFYNVSLFLMTLCFGFDSVHWFLKCALVSNNEFWF